MAGARWEALERALTVAEQGRTYIWTTGVSLGAN
jgi:hypothetical protein